VSGALNTVAPGCMVKIESTAHGTSGRFYKMVENAKARAATGQPLSLLDYRLHFFGWFMDEKYRLQHNLVTLTTEHQEYFATLQAKYGIYLTPDQKAWYARKELDLGPDKMKEEPSHIDECFFNSMEGTWFKREMTKARNSQWSS
jgi:hypothetical protein